MARVAPTRPECRAWVWIGKHLGLFTDKVEVENKLHPKSDAEGANDRLGQLLGRLAARQRDTVGAATQNGERRT